MALWQAKQACPEINFVSPRMDLYLRFSCMAHEIYAEYTDLQEPYGIDECWLDCTSSTTIKGDGLKIATEISNRLKSELGVTVSIGVPYNKIFAKLGSDYMNRMQLPRCTRMNTRRKHGKKIIPYIHMDTSRKQRRHRRMAYKRFDLNERQNKIYDYICVMKMEF
jgi:nucleotidyltransferase/DNA polymerase involved in DNA repair